MNNKTTPVDMAEPFPASDERAAFEASEPGMNLARDEDGEYENPCVASAWAGYQAGRAAALAQADDSPELTDAEIDAVWKGLNGDTEWLRTFGYQQFARAILAAAPVTPVTVRDAIDAAELQTLLISEFECYRPTHPAGLMAWARIALLDCSPHRAAPAAQGDARDASDKALLDFMETDHRLHVATTYAGLSYVPTFEVAKMTGYIGNDQLTHISSGKTLREAIAAAIAAKAAA